MDDWKNTSFPALEEQVIQHWVAHDVMQQVRQEVELCPTLVFLDGPPFATGTMHAGHFLVSTIKDTLIRYFTMKRIRVDRNNSWDCHGIPIEMLAKQIIGYQTKKDLLEYGINKHNEVCRQMVSDCVKSWHVDFERMGRWINPDLECQTMDPKFMDRVIRTFSELYKKNMIYEGYKVMPYCCDCQTPLSHFESKLNYLDISELSIVCCFEVLSTSDSVFKHEKDHPTYILGWTTTPWTLPSNIAICANPNSEIAYAFDRKKSSYILVSIQTFETYPKLNSVPGSEKDGQTSQNQEVERFELITTIPSSDLKGIKYKPPFTSDTDPDRAFRVITDPFVKTEGTGFVHCSPAHGEDDHRVCQSNQLPVLSLINDEGRFISGDFNGLYFKDANKPIIDNLNKRGLIFESKMHTHSYPFCYRTNTPLIYKLVPGWFLRASDPVFRQQMLESNQQINWLPPNVGTIDFGNWFKSSVDWCISRSRYWGTPIPIWKSDDGTEVVCISSSEELGADLQDWHIENVDHLTLTKNGKILRRVEGVLDCWFESGSMALSTPADFIVESKDQTRGWFYTLNVLSTALHNQPAFRNVIVTGIINAKDGTKMSKSKKNYTDPKILIDKYGADAIRFYLLSTPVVKSESIKFDETVLGKLQQNTSVKIYNMVLFLVEKIKLYGGIDYPSKKELESMPNILDRWIINKSGLLCQTLNGDFTSYQMANIAPNIGSYIEQLTNWYLKMARERLKGISYFGHNKGDWLQSLQTLLFVLHKFILMVAPVMPFIAETTYAMLKPYVPNPKESIHLDLFPDPRDFVFRTEDLETKFHIIQNVITLIREIRAGLGFNSRRPISYVEIACLDGSHWEIIQDILCYITTESNVMEVRKMENPDIGYKIEPLYPDFTSWMKSIGQVHRMKEIVPLLNSMSMADIEQKTRIKLDPKLFISKPYLKNPNRFTKLANNVIVRVDGSYDDIIQTEHLVRLVNRSIQMHRKSQGLKPWQVITISYFTSCAKLQDVLKQNKSKFISKNLEDLVEAEEAGVATLYEILGKDLYLNVLGDHNLKKNPSEKMSNPNIVIL